MKPVYYVREHQIAQAIEAVSKNPTQFHTSDVFLQTDDPGVRLEVEKPSRSGQLPRLFAQLEGGQLRLELKERTGKKAKEQYFCGHDGCYLVPAAWPAKPGKGHFGFERNAFLLTWNPANWPWPPADHRRKSEETKRHRPSRDRWSTGSRGSGIGPGDRVYLVKLGASKPKGLVGSGRAASSIFQDRHWDNDRDGDANFVHLVWDMLLDPETDGCMPLPPTGCSPQLADVHWTPETSGTRLPGESSEELDGFWRAFLEGRGLHPASETAVQDAIRGVRCQVEVEETGEKLDEEGDFEPKSADHARVKVLREVALRQGQPEFRRELLRAYEGRCAITNCDVVQALDAAHIEPWAEGHPNSLPNGLLLRSDVHALFDCGLITISSELRVILGESIRGSQYADLHGLLLRPPADQADRPAPAALAAHRTRSRGAGRPQ